MLWCRIDFTQCLIFGQHGLELRNWRIFGWHGDLMNSLVHRNWGENFVKLFLDFSKYISRVSPSAYGDGQFPARPQWSVSQPLKIQKRVSLPENSSPLGKDPGYTLRALADGGQLRVNFVRLRFQDLGG
jgi:hypothetical protein